MITGARCVCGEVMHGDKMFFEGVGCVCRDEMFFEGVGCASKKVFRGDKMYALCCVQFLNRLHVILPDTFGNVHARLQRLPPRFQHAGIVNLGARAECLI